MRYAIALMILAATVTAQGATRRSVVAVADGHDSYSIEVDRNSNGTRPSGVLWFGVTVPRAYVEVVSMQIVDEVTGEVETATNSVPVPHSLCKWSEGDDAPTARSEAEIAAYDADVAAQAESAWQARQAAKHPLLQGAENAFMVVLKRGEFIAADVDRLAPGTALTVKGALLEAEVADPTNETVRVLSDKLDRLQGLIRDLGGEPDDAAVHE